MNKFKKKKRNKRCIKMIEEKQGVLGGKIVSFAIPL